MVRGTQMHQYCLSQAPALLSPHYIAWQQCLRPEPLAICRLPAVRLHEKVC